MTPDVLVGTGRSQENPVSMLDVLVVFGGTGNQASPRLRLEVSVGTLKVRVVAFVGTMKCLSCLSSLQPEGMTQGSKGCDPLGAAAGPVALVTWLPMALTAPRGTAAAVVASTASAAMLIFILIGWLGSDDDRLLVEESGKLPAPGSSGSMHRAEQRREGETSFTGLLADWQRSYTPRDGYIACGPQQNL